MSEKERKIYVTVEYPTPKGTLCCKIRTSSAIFVCTCWVDLTLRGAVKTIVGGDRKGNVTLCPPLLWLDT